MAREFRLGDQVRVGLRVGTIYAMPTRGGGPLADCYRVADHENPHHATWSSYATEDEMSHATPPDIPRERVADLHAAVVKRVEQLKAECYHDAAWTSDDPRALRDELATFAEALRLLLEVEP